MKPTFLQLFNENDCQWLEGQGQISHKISKNHVIVGSHYYFNINLAYFCLISSTVKIAFQ